jgi:lipopolysaccharide-assembly LptC-related protein
MTAPKGAGPALSALSALAALASLALALAAGAQNPPSPAGSQKPKECDVVITGVVVNGVPTHSQSFGTPTGQNNVFIGGGFDARCAGTDQHIRSDSAEQYGDEKRMILIGNVHYTEAKMKLDADRMTYYTGEERLVAEGNVKGITSTGTHFTGPRAEYLRVAKGIRDRSRLIAEPRPNVWLSPKDAGTTTKDSTNLQADRVISENDSLVYAKGRVIIERPDLSTTSDSAFMDNGREFVRLVYSPRIVGRGERKFTLDGDVIDIFSKQRKVQRVKSAGKAKAVSDDMVMTADTIDLRITDEKLSRAYAWGPTHARAKSKDQDLTADSIEVLMPAQVLREMHSVGRAMAVSVADTAKIISKDPDRLTGDTIVAYFDTVATGDTTNRPAVRRIIALGSQKPATSYYQVAPSGSGKTDKPNINYVTGDLITVEFKNHQVESVTVTGHASGFYLDAATDSSRAGAAADSAAKKLSPAPKSPATKQPPSKRQPPAGTKPQAPDSTKRPSLAPSMRSSMRPSMPPESGT